MTVQSIASTSDGGYIVGGSFTQTIAVANEILTSKGSVDGIIIKYESNGEVEWVKTYGGTSADNIYSVAETEDGGYIVGGTFEGTITVGDKTIRSAGSSYSDAIIIKYDANGEVEWVKSYGSVRWDSINSVAGTSNGGFIAGGRFNGTINIEGTWIGNGNDDGIVIKYDGDENIEWYKQFGGINNDEINSVVGTTDGGCIAVGTFEGTITVGDKTITSAGLSDGVVIKYDSQGEIRWAKSYGATGTDYISSVVGTTDGGCIVGGMFEGTITVGDKIITSTGGSDGIIIKYDSEGDVEWIKTYGGISNDYIDSIAETEDEGVVVGGHFYGTIQVGNDTLISKGNADGIVIKYDGQGEVEWVKSYGGTSNDYIYSVAETIDGEIIAGYNEGIIKYRKIEKPMIKEKYIHSIGARQLDGITRISSTKDGGYLAGGYFQGAIQIGNETVISNNNTDGIVIKYDNEGNVEWYKHIGGFFEDRITFVLATKNGGYLVGGYFQGTIQIENETLTNNSGSDGIIIKYDENNNMEWYKQIEGTNNISLYSAFETQDGGLLIGGYFQETIQIEDETIFSKGGVDGIAVKLNNNGDLEWYRQIGGTGFDVINSVMETNNGGTLIGARFAGPIQIGNEIIQSTDLNADSILIKYDRQGNVEWHTPINGIFEDVITSVVETSDGGYIVGGYFSNTLQIEKNIITARGTTNDGIIIKFDSNGRVEWYKQIGGSQGIWIETVATTSDGGYIAGGFFQGTIQIENETIISNGYDDVMVIKYGNKGNLEWIKTFGGDGHDQIFTVAELSDGSIIVGGDYYSSRIDFGDKTIRNNGSSPDGFIANFLPIWGAAEQTELNVKNIRKEYIITTKVEPIDGIKGGTISGDGKAVYETVKHGDNSIEEIKMTPEENYEIIGITVNEVEFPYTVNPDGTFVMPKFTNVQEDKHIVVKYAKKDNKITIIKKDSASGATLPGATFKLDQIEEREEPEQNVIGNLVNNSDIFYEVDLNSEITGVLGELTNNGEHYFVEKDGTYVPTNSKTWQVANVPGATGGVGNKTANSYIKLDLNGKDGKYFVVVNARVSSQRNYDYGYATINNSTYPPTYSNGVGRFMYISGAGADTDYTSAVLDGNDTYYIHLGYYKNRNTDTNEDQVVINSVKVYKANEFEYNFIENEGKYESTNQEKPNTTSNSYIPIDLRGKTGKYNLTVNAKVSSQSGYDIGYATITENTNRVAYNDIMNVNRFIYISGTTGSSAKDNDYTTILEGGKIYYLHLGYYKNASGDQGEDKFIVNNIRVSLSGEDLYHSEEITTNSEGKAITSVPFGKYKITEVKAPEGYLLNTSIPDIEFRGTEGSPREFIVENQKIANITVHHYKKGTEEKVAEDEKQEGIIGEEYTTSPKLDLQKYELEVVNGELVLPGNATGEFTEEDIVVIYEYVPKQIPLTVHHYIEGTTDKVPLKTIGEVAEDEISYGEEHQEYITAPKTAEELNPKYELVETPENAEGTYEFNEVIVVYYYKLKQVKITTRVEGEGGTISGEGLKPYETVEYLEDSTKEIKVVPNVGYKVKRITVNGAEIDFTENMDRTVVLDKFEEMVENKEVVVEFEILPGTVVVHHYIEGTTIKVPAKEEGKVVPTEVKTGEPGTSYATKPSENASLEYEIVNENPEKASGEYIEDQTIEVIYYYKPREFNPEITNKITKEAKATKTVEREETVGGQTVQTQVEVLTKKDGEITYKIKYEVEIKDYIGKAKIGVVDTLPAAIDEDKSDIKEGTYDVAEKTITWEEEVNVDTYTNGTYTKTIEKEITIVYDGQNVNENLENTAKGTTTIYYLQSHPISPGEERKKVEATAKAVIEQEYKKDLRVEKVWDDNNDAKGKRPGSIKLQLLANGLATLDGTTLRNIILSTNNEVQGNTNKWAYTFHDLNVYDSQGQEIEYTIEETEVNQGELSYYETPTLAGENPIVITNTYKLQEAELDSSIEKTGTVEIEKSEEVVEYKIEYKAEVKEYVGKAKIIVVDTLPNKIDEAKSDLAEGIYDENTKTITWENIEEIDTVANGTKEIEITKEIKIVYKDLDLKQDEIENHVRGRIELLDEDKKTEVEDTHKTMITAKGKVVAKYVDIETEKEIAKKETLEGRIGKEYATEQKEIANYMYVKDSKNTKGIYKEEEQTVIYYYKKVSFNIGVEKEIADILVNGESKFNPANGVKLGKVEINKKKVDEARIAVKYKILVKNTAGLKGTAIIEERIPGGFTLAEESKALWKEENGKIFTEVELEVGESKELEIVLDWKQGEANLGIQTNVVEITKTENELDQKDEIEEDNKSKAEIIITISTGEERAIVDGNSWHKPTYTLAAIILIMLLQLNILKKIGA